jgi:hypothetical protein
LKLTEFTIGSERREGKNVTSEFEVFCALRRWKTWWTSEH